MGEVYRAFHREQQREIALKRLPAAFATNPEFVERFRRESHAAASLNSPHVIPIHAFGEIDEQLYLEMRLVDGVDLAQLIEAEGPLELGRTIKILGQAAEALDAAHAKQLIHRDVKPSNLLIAAHDFVYLVDFGIAHNVGLTTAGTALTATGATIGTLDYMAPERFLGQAVDRRVDVYSLACVFYESLTGKPPFPFPENSSPALLNAHLNTPPPRVTSLRPDLSPAVDDVIARGMAKNPAERYPTASALAEAAERAVHERYVPRTVLPPAGTSQWQLPPPPPSPAPRATPVPRSAAGWVVAAVSLVAVAVLSGVLLLSGTGVGDADDGAGTGTPTGAPGEPTPGGQAAAGQPDASAPTPSSPEGSPSSVPTGDARPAGDLGLAMPISAPPCDGSYAVFVAAAIDPSRYRQEVQSYLERTPGARYLLTEQSCRSLAARSAQGTAIYAVYLGPFGSLNEACATLAQAGGDSYIRRLDNTSPVGEFVGC